MMLSWLQRLFSRPAPVIGPEPAGAMPEPEAGPASDAAPAAASDPASDPVPAPAPAPAGPPVSFEQLDRVNNAWDAWLFGRERDGLDSNPLEAQVLELLEANARQSGAALVRRMPGLVPQLLQSLRSENFSGAALSRTISSDVVLVAEVIRLANSACQGSGASIASVEHAVILIGQEGLRQLITSVAFRPIIDIHSGCWTSRLAPRLWEHAERCAIGCRALAREAGVDPFEAFLAGLVHNVGLIVALRVMDQVAEDGTGLGSEVFCAELARTARALTCGIGRAWDFAPAVNQALAEQGGVRRGVRISALGRLLTQCDYLARLRALAAEGLLDDGDPALLAGLPVDVLACYSALEGTADASSS
jgi:hypothetical protein